jgi:hypothetical protein
MKKDFANQRTFGVAKLISHRASAMAYQRDAPFQPSEPIRTIRSIRG